MRIKRGTTYSDDLLSVAVRFDCQHRGEVIRRETCETCANKAKLKVFACSIHGECTLAKQLGEIKCCAGCGDYAPAKEQE